MKFFVVTMTSVYELSMGKDGYPVVEKIARREYSRVAIGEILTGGGLVGIESDGIILYDADHPNSDKRPDSMSVSTAFLGARTTPIVALFKNKKKAIECFFHSKKLKKGDIRWKKETEEVLRQIGDNHSVFIISKSNPIYK